MPVIRTEKKANFTVISNTILRDKKLSLKAKGLLVQMLSLREDWRYTVSGLAEINSEGKDAIRTALQELEKNGYLVRHQNTNSEGRFDSNEYTIREIPNIDEQPVSSPTDEPLSKNSPVDRPLTDNPTTDKPLTDKPLTDKPLTGKPLTDKPLTNNPLMNNPTQISTDISRTDGVTTYLSNTDSFSLSVHQTNGISEEENEEATTRERMQKQIEYEVMVERYNRAQLDELVEIMVEVALNKSPTTKIGRDQEFSTDYVQSHFRKITAAHIERVMDGLADNTTVVRNTKAYLKATLFNSITTIENYYVMQDNLEHF